MAERLVDYVGGGVHHFIFMACAPGDISAQIPLLFDEVVPQIRQHPPGPGLPSSVTST